MRFPFSRFLGWIALVQVAGLVGCCSKNARNTVSGDYLNSMPTTEASMEAPVASKAGSNEDIFGTVPESEPDLPPGSAVWIHMGDQDHSLQEFAAIATQRVAREEKSPPAPGTHVEIVFDLDGKDVFAQVILGSGIGAPHWVVTIDRQLKVTSYKKVLGRD